MAYVYKHTRLDTNEVFYIGIGTDKYYFRPKDKIRRNIHWKNIVNLTDWTYEVIFEHESLEVVKQKEIELISFYGRTTEGGTLCNMTLGGEGTLGLKPKNSKKCYGLNPEGKIFEFESMHDAAKMLGDVRLNSNINRVCKGKLKTCKGWNFSYIKEDLYNPIIKNTGSPIKCYGLNPDNQIIEFNSITEAAIKMGNINLSGTICGICKGKNITYKEWRFAYKKEDLTLKRNKKVYYRKCYGLSPNGDFIEFSSIAEAAINLGNILLSGNISNVCKGKRNTCNGWYFSYNDFQKKG